MKRKRFTEEQIIAVLREHETGAKAGDLARKHGIMERNRHGLHSNRSHYRRMRIVPGDFKILNPIIVYTFWSPEQVQFRERPRLAS